MVIWETFSELKVEENLPRSGEKTHNFVVEKLEKYKPKQFLKQEM